MSLRAAVILRPVALKRESTCSAFLARSPACCREASATETTSTNLSAFSPPQRLTARLLRLSCNNVMLASVKASRGAGSHRSLAQVMHLGDLFPLSVSSIGPVFSVAATGGVMAAQAGWWSLPTIAVVAIPFVISSFVFRMLNRHFPHAGASYHWSGRVIGKGMSRYQAWVLILAYFTSIPPIAVPAASYTLALVAPGWHAPAAVHVAITMFWILFAATPLLLGAKPTANITKAFFGLEMLSLVAFGVLGLVNLHRLAVPIHFGPLPVGGVMIVAVVAATVLDGWEIDSYAAEESRRPRKDPGVSGMVGAFLALGFYAILYPLMFAETPMKLLFNASDPLALWAHRMIPGYSWAILIPILGSTAGGLWLTTYILTRALYAMGREELIPASFARTNRHRAPDVATISVLGLALLVSILELTVSSLGTFFSLVLSAAGFFLVAEFFLDNVTAIAFLTRWHKKGRGTPEEVASASGEERRRLESGHGHFWMLIGAVLSALMLGAMMVAFFIYGPKGIGNGIDRTLAVLILLGLVFVALTRKRGRNVYEFHGQDAPIVESTHTPVG